VGRHQPVRSLSRRGFLSAALVGLAPKSWRPLAGTLVHESHELGHRLRDGAAFATPARTERRDIVIVGGGIAGLAAAWQLDRRGVTDVVVLEMEPAAGGNARWGENDITAYPWAAHYVPVPGRAGGVVRELFTDLGVFDGTHWEERHLVHAPHERLFVHGRWQEGLEPAVGPTRRDRDQFARFADRVAALRDTGRFTIPVAAGLAMDPAPAEDALSFGAWLDREGFDSPWLRWMVDYACRDDYGARAADVSAWAGLLYYAGRDEEQDGPLTWPEGNGWIVRRVLERLGPRVETGQLVYRVIRRGPRWHVLTPEVEWVADSVIVAAPALVASRIVEGAPRAAITYSPWFTSNLTLDRWPRETGTEVAWDNVIFDSPSLGYVVATHQHLRRHLPRTVWTHYWALADQPAADARQWLLAQDWTSLSDRVLADLSRAHPDIRDCVARIDIMRLGHAMPRPTPGFLSDPARKALQVGHDGVFYAHSDVSGLPLFEEALARGVLAADRALARLGGRTQETGGRR
jgi:glycine/D-amino acid oxidase-like deaminating enzyme